MNYCQTTPKKEDDAPPFKILFVDDDIRYLHMVKAFIDNTLDKNGKLVVYAESAEQALAEIRKRQFNLIFTDFVMGDMNGIKLASIARDLISGISIILITGSPVTQEIMDKAANADISRIIAKPFNLNILREIIEKEQKKYAGGYHEKAAISVTLSI